MFGSKINRDFVEFKVNNVGLEQGLRNSHFSKTSHRCEMFNYRTSLEVYIFGVQLVFDRPVIRILKPFIDVVHEDLIF